MKNNPVSLILLIVSAMIISTWGFITLTRPADARDNGSKAIDSYRLYLPLMDREYRITYGESVYIPAGEFLMGCDLEHNANFLCDSDELPIHLVYLAAYFIDKYEVTNAEYQQCVNAQVCSLPGSFASETRTSYYDNAAFSNFPVLSVNWYQANTYCGWVGKRLPTEAEWEKAARGASIRAYPWGDQAANCTLANHYFFDGYVSNLCKGDTTPVGTYPEGASVYEVMDMAGNVMEWVNDWYDPYYYNSLPYDNPTGPDSGLLGRVIRGGSWISFSEDILTAERLNDSPDDQLSYLGFRCADSP